LKGKPIEKATADEGYLLVSSSSPESQEGPCCEMGLKTEDGVAIQGSVSLYFYLIRNGIDFHPLTLPYVYVAMSLSVSFHLTSNELDGYE